MRKWIRIIVIHRDSGKQHSVSRFMTLWAAFLTIFFTNVSFGNVVGADTQNFNPTTSGLDFVTVESAQTLDPGIVNFGLFLNDQENSLPYFANDPQSRTRFSDAIISGDLNVGIGLLPGLDFGISAPQVLGQNSPGTGFHGEYNSLGNTEVRINSKYQFYGNREYGLALEVSANLNRIGNNPYVGTGAGPTTNFQLIGDTTVGKFKLGLNVGYRLRQPGKAIASEAPITPLGNQYIASGAISYLLSSIQTKLIAEIFGSAPEKNLNTFSSRTAGSCEALFGAKHDLTTSLSAHFGIGSQINNGISSPYWRIYTGVNYDLGQPTPSQSPTKIQTVSQTTLPKLDPFSGPPKLQEKIVIHDVLFEYDSANLVVGGPDATLSKLANYLMTKPVFTRLIIEGHTDSIGSDSYNLDLSKRRAETIRKWLIDRYHLPGTKIIAVGRGKRMPIADNGNYQGRQLNRRVAFTIYRDMAKENQVAAGKEKR